MTDPRGIPEITFTDNGRAIEVLYRVTSDHSATIPLDDLPFDVDELYDERGADTDRDKLDAIAEEIEPDLSILADQTDLDTADGVDYELVYKPND